MSTDVCEQFGKRLRQLRNERSWSQEELAHRVGIDVSYLSELENGKKEPCLRKMKELAQGLGVPLTRIGKWIVASRPNGKNCRQGCQEIAKVLRNCGPNTDGLGRQPTPA